MRTIGLSNSPTGPYSLLRKFVDWKESGDSVAAFSATACGIGDPSCTAPIATGDPSLAAYGVQNLPAEVVNLSVPWGFRGFLELSGDGALATRVAMETGGPFWAMSGVPSWIISRSELEGVAPAAGVTLDPSRGHLMGQTYDCTGRIGGVSVDVEGADEQTRIVYFANGEPSSTATETESCEPFSARCGWYFAFNVPTGLTAIDAVHRPTGTRVGPLLAVVRAGSVTDRDEAPWESAPAAAGDGGS
jgi:hypothetical protein